jgi:hypothetical protein
MRDLEIADLELMREDGWGVGEQEGENENDYPEAFLETAKKGFLRPNRARIE